MGSATAGDGGATSCLAVWLFGYDQGQKGEWEESGGASLCRKDWPVTDCT